jgi:putative salt-induced outer membrane protein YdiY
MCLPPRALLRLTWVLGLAALAPAALGAQDDVKRLHFTGNLGFVNTAGNSELTTLGGDETLRYVTRDSLWKFQQTAAVVYGRSRDSTTASSYSAGGRLDRMLSARLAAFAGATWQRNRFAGINRRFEEVLGLAYDLLALERDKLVVEVGAAFTQQRNTAGLDDNFVGARTAGTYKHLLTEKAFVQQMAEFLSNLETSTDYRINSETSLAAPISSTIALKMAYTIHFDHLPEPGFEKSDRILISGIQVTF